MTSLAQTLKNVAADSSIALILRVVGLPLTYLTSIVIARLFGAEQMGTYFIAINLAGILSMFCSLGLDKGLLRYTAALNAAGEINIKSMLRPALALVTFLSLLMALIIYAGRMWLAKWFNSPDLPQLVIFVALSLPLMVIARLFTETVRALGWVRWLALEENLLSPLVFLALLYALSYGSGLLNTPQVLGSAFLAKTALGGFLLGGFLWFMTRHFQPGTSHASLFELLVYSWPIFLSMLSGILFTSLDTLILGLFTAPKDVAYYGIATKLAVFLSVPLVAVNAVVPPLFAKFHQLGELANLEMLAQTSARWMYYSSLPIALLLILLAPSILGLFGEDFLKARLALYILVTAQLINVAAGSVGLLLQMTGHQWEMMRLQIVVGVATLILMPTLAYAMGLNGISLATALSIASINILTVVACWRCLGIKAYATKTKMANLGGALGVGLFLLSEPFLGPLVAGLLFLVGYFCLVAGTLKRELAFLYQPQQLEVVE